MGVVCGADVEDAATPVDDTPLRYGGDGMIEPHLPKGSRMRNMDWVSCHTADL